MVISQSRSKLILFLVPGSLFILGLGGLGLSAGIILALKGEINLVLIGAVLFVISFGVFVMWVGVASFVRPVQIVTTPDGFTVRYLTGNRSWRWQDVSHFRRRGTAHGGTVGIAFDYADNGAQKLGTLPPSWPIGTGEVIALLEAERVRHVIA